MNHKYKYNYETNKVENIIQKCINNTQFYGIFSITRRMKMMTTTMTATATLMIQYMKYTEQNMFVENVCNFFFLPNVEKKTTTTTTTARKKKAVDFYLNLRVNSKLSLLTFYFYWKINIVHFFFVHSFATCLKGEKKKWATNSIFSFHLTFNAASRCRYPILL